MNKFIISCGSAVDLTEEHLKRRNIDWIPFTYFVDGKEYPEFLIASLNLSFASEIAVSGRPIIATWGIELIVSTSTLIS